MNRFNRDYRAGSLHTMPPSSATIPLPLPQILGNSACTGSDDRSPSLPDQPDRETRWLNPPDLESVGTMTGFDSGACRWRPTIS